MVLRTGLFKGLCGAVKDPCRVVVVGVSSAPFPCDRL